MQRIPSIQSVARRISVAMAAAFAALISIPPAPAYQSGHSVSLLQSRPDLRLVRIWTPDNAEHPATLLAGRQITVCVEVSNRGNAPSLTSQLHFEADGSQARMDNLAAGLGEIAAGARVELCLPMTIPPGTAVFAAVAYPGDRNLEADPYDNLEIAQVVTVRPNLLVARVWTPDNAEDPTTLFAGREITVCVEVSNRGNAPSLSSQLHFEADGSRARMDNLATGLGEIAAGARVELCLPMTIPPGTAVFSAVAFTGDEAEESEPSDNRLDARVVAAPVINLADLYIVRVWSPDNPTQPSAIPTGGPVNLCVEYGNRGPAPARRIYATFDVRTDRNTGYSWGTAIGELGPGVATEWCHELGISEHAITLRIYIGPGEPAEAQPADNELSVTLRAPAEDPPVSAPPVEALADLRVESLGLDDGDCDPGRNRVVAVVRNAGNERARDFIVRLWIDGEERDSDTIDRLDPGDDRRVRFERTILEEGAHQLRVAVDAGAHVDETREDNNELSANATCRAPKPDLEIVAISIDDQDCDPGRNRINVTVRNSGPGRADRFDVRLWVGSREEGDEAIDDLGPGEDKRVRFSGVELRSGNHQLRARADAGNRVEESNEGNNERTSTVSCVEEPRRGN